VTPALLHRAAKSRRSPEQRLFGGGAIFGRAALSGLVVRRAGGGGSGADPAGGSSGGCEPATPSGAAALP
jgi:hypothetical protein